MRNLFLSICLTIVLFLTAGAQALRLPSSGIIDSQPVIEKRVKDYAKALMDFPKNQEMDSILRFYSKEFSGMHDGRTIYLNSIKDGLSSILETNRAGKRVEITAKPRNIRVKMDGDIAWADYDAEVSIRIDGHLIQDERQKCSDKFKKHESDWLLIHSIVTVEKQPVYAEPAKKPEETITQSSSNPIEIVNSTFSVAAGNYRLFEIRLNKFSRVTGRFDVGGSRWSDIRVYCIPVQEYDNWRNNRPFRYWHYSGQVVSGSIDVWLQQGVHLLIFSNLHSKVMGADVRAFITTTP